MFSCECGFTNVEWIDPSVKRICGRCSSLVKFTDRSTQNKLGAYFKINDDELSNRYTQIINALKTLKSANNRMISNFLNIPINCVTPRTKELRDMKRPLIKEDCVKVDDLTNRMTTYWCLV